MAKLNRRKTPRDTDRLKALQQSMEALLAESRFLRQRLAAIDRREETKELRRLLDERSRNRMLLDWDDLDDPPVH